MLIFFNCSSDCASPMSRALPRKLALLVIAPLFLDSVFPGFGFTSSKPCYQRAGWRNLHRCHLTRLATAAISGQGFGEYTDTLRSLPPEKRLQHVTKLKEGDFVALTDALTKNREDEGIPQCVLHAVKLAAQNVSIVIAGVDKGGSTCTRTDIKYSSDLDLNVRTTRNMTRDDRVNFKDALVDLLPKWTDGWTFVHMGKKSSN